MKLSGVVVLLGVLPAGLVAQDARFEVFPGYHDVQSIRFQPRATVDWEALVSPELTALPIPTTDTLILGRYRPLIDDYGSVEIRHTIPIPDTLTEGYSYAVGVAGIVRLDLDSARVITRLRFDYGGTELVGRQSWGEVFGSTSPREQFDGGGFVIQSESPVEFDIRPATLTADDILLGSHAVQQTPDGGYSGRGTVFWDIVAQYRFSQRGESEEWLFVRWEPDHELFEAGCEYRYGLFRLEGDGGPPTQVAWTSYRCDV